MHLSLLRCCLKWIKQCQQEISQCKLRSAALKRPTLISVLRMLPLFCQAALKPPTLSSDLRKLPPPCQELHTLLHRSVL
ncbi:hypothetical protein AAVH_15960 [Aphelenchoides avenae]|nr:hypothetical protein AAVH_15960 [Aphelenchus avenae]